MLRRGVPSLVPIILASEARKSSDRNSIGVPCGVRSAAVSIAREHLWRHYVLCGDNSLECGKPVAIVRSRPCQYRRQLAPYRSDKWQPTREALAQRQGAGRKRPKPEALQVGRNHHTSSRHAPITARPSVAPSTAALKPARTQSRICSLWGLIQERDRLTHAVATRHGEGRSNELDWLLAQNAPQQATEESGETILAGFPLATPESIEEDVAKQYGLQLVRRLTPESLNRRIVVYRIPDSRAVADVVAALKVDQRVSSAQANVRYSLAAQQPPDRKIPLRPWCRPHTAF
jgi:hypothetical protein